MKKFIRFLWEGIKRFATTWGLVDIARRVSSALGKIFKKRRKKRDECEEYRKLLEVDDRGIYTLGVEIDEPEDAKAYFEIWEKCFKKVFKKRRYYIYADVVVHSTYADFVLRVSSKQITEEWMEKDFHFAWTKILESLYENIAAVEMSLAGSRMKDYEFYFYAVFKGWWKR